MFEDPQVRSAVYLNRFLTFEVPHGELPVSLRTWTETRLQPIAAGGLACWHAGNQRPAFLELHEIRLPGLLRLLEIGDQLPGDRQ
jgi:hypothetical protein